MTIENDIEVCRKLWVEFTPGKTLFDLWDFRFRFLQAYHYPLHFLVIQKNGQNAGLLPLWFIPEKKIYCWFGDLGDGSNWQEDNTLFVKEPELVTELIRNAPHPLVLNSFSEEASHMIADQLELAGRSPKYLYDLEGIKGVDEILEKLPKKIRYDLKKSRSDSESQTQVVYDDFSDYDGLIKLITERYQDSYLTHKPLVECFRSLMEAGRKEASFKSRMISVKKGEQLVGACLVFIYNGIYYPFLMGNDFLAVSGVGKYMILLFFEDALKMGAWRIDMLEGVEGCYKEKYFYPVYLYSYKA